jgi:hypothetical protein
MDHEKRRRGDVIPCRHRPRGSCGSGCSGRGTRRAPQEGACGTSDPNARSRGYRRCSRPRGGRGGRRCGRERVVSDISSPAILKHALGSRSAMFQRHLPRRSQCPIFRAIPGIRPADRRRGSECRAGAMPRMYKNAQGGREWHTTARSCATALLVVLSALQSPSRCQLGRLLTSGAGGVLLDGAALADKGVLAGLGGRAGKAARHDGRAEPGGEARRAAEELALREHGEEGCARGRVSGLGVEGRQWLVGCVDGKAGGPVCQCAVWIVGRGVRSAIRSFPALLRDGELPQGLEKERRTGADSCDRTSGRTIRPPPTHVPRSRGAGITL